MDAGSREIRPIVLRAVVAGVAGALTFVLLQELKGYPQHIAGFIGGQVVRQGGYAPGLAAPIGWAIHLAVALTYAGLFAALCSLAARTGVRAARLTGLALIPVLGYLTTMVAAPAISIVISVLAGHGFPDNVAPLNRGVSFALWNHLAFFGVCWAVLFIPASRSSVRAREAEAPTGS